MFVKNRIARKLINIAGINRRKVFAIGFNKTATSSLHALFKSLGLLSYHGPKWRDCQNLRLLRSFDCFSDGRPSDIPKLDKLFPRSKFILQVRDLENWIYSRLAHIDRARASGEVLENPGWEPTEYAVKRWIENRNSYHSFVLRYFAQRPQDLLIINYIRDPFAADRVAKFLGFEGGYEKPYTNKNPGKDRPAHHKQILYNSLRELGIPEKELAYDILCRSLSASGSQEILPWDTSLLDGGSRLGRCALAGGAE